MTKDKERTRDKFICRSLFERVTFEGEFILAKASASVEAVSKGKIGLCASLSSVSGEVGDKAVLDPTPGELLWSWGSSIFFFYEEGCKHGYSGAVS